MRGHGDFEARVEGAEVLHTGVREENTPPEKKALGKTSLKTHNQGLERFLLPMSLRSQMSRTSHREQVGPGTSAKSSARACSTHTYMYKLGNVGFNLRPSVVDLFATLNYDS